MQVQFSGVGILNRQVADNQKNSLEKTGLAAFLKLERTVGGPNSLCISRQKDGLDQMVWISDLDLIKVTQDNHDGAGFPPELADATAETLRRAPGKFTDALIQVLESIPMAKLHDSIFNYAQARQTDGKDAEGKPVLEITI